MPAHPAYSYKTAKQQSGQTSAKKSVIYWASHLFIALFLFIFLFQTALFYGYTVQYEQPINSAVIWSAIMLFLLSICYFYNWKAEDVKDLLAVWVWTIPLAYLISSVHAVSSHFAMSMVMLNTLYAVFFLLAVAFAREQRGAEIIQQAIVFSGYAAVFYCFMNMFGNTYFKDAVMLEGAGLRLTSVFQYANAYAAYLLAILLSALWLLMNSRRWYIVLLHAAMVVPLLLSFFMTLSRGGIVMLPVILLAILPFYGIVRQISFFLYLIIGSVGALVIIQPVTAMTLDMLKRVTAAGPLNPSTVSLFDGQSLKGWLLVGAVSIAAGTLILLSERYLVPVMEQKLLKLSKLRWANLYIPSLLIVFGLLGLLLLSEIGVVAKLLPAELQKRVESINFQQHSVLERLTMYRDSFKVFKDYPVTGAGGGGWNMLYQKYQNNPYIVRQVHNYFLQFMVETGLLGALALLALVVSVYWLYTRHFFKQSDGERGTHQIFYIVSVAILFHSVLDFEMSYVYLSAVVFLCLGGMAASIKQPLNFRKAGWLQAMNKGAYRFIYPGLICAVSLVLMFVSMKEIQGARHFFEAVDKLNVKSPALEEVFKSLDAALAASPGHPTYLNLKIRLLYEAYNQTKDARFEQDAKQYLAVLDRKEPYEKQRLEFEFNQYVSEGKLNEALTVTERSLQQGIWGINIDPERPNWYERAVALNFELGNRARAANQTELNVKYWNRAEQLYQTVITKQESLKSLPQGQLQGEPFGITPEMSFFIGQLYFYRQDYQKAAEALKPNVNEQTGKPVVRAVVRWYLASLQKQGQADVNVYNSFVAKHPEEKTEITKLAGQ